jgi:hypothetical protein
MRGSFDAPEPENLSAATGRETPDGAGPYIGWAETPSPYAKPYESSLRASSYASGAASACRARWRPRRTSRSVVESDQPSGRFGGGLVGGSS